MDSRDSSRAARGRLSGPEPTACVLRARCKGRRPSRTKRQSVLVASLKREHNCTLASRDGRDGDFTGTPVQLSLFGRLVYLLCASGVAIGALGTAGLAFLWGRGSLIVAVLVWLLMLCILAAWWHKASRTLARADL